MAGKRWLWEKCNLVIDQVIHIHDKRAFLRTYPLALKEKNAYYFPRVRNTACPILILWMPHSSPNQNGTRFVLAEETGKHSLSPALPKNSTVCAATFRAGTSKETYYTSCQTRLLYLQHELWPLTRTSALYFVGGLLLLNPTEPLSPNRKSSLGRFTFHLKHPPPGILMKIYFFPSPELGDIYCSDYSFTIKTRCSYPTTERKSDFETKTKTLLSIIQIEKVRSNNREQDFALKRADCCFGALKVVLRLGCAFTPFGKPEQRTSRKKTTSSRCHALGTLHLSMSIDTDHRVVRQTGGHAIQVLKVGGWSNRCDYALLLWKGRVRSWKEALFHGK